MRVPIEDCEVIAPNFKKRLSGVTSTIIQLLPLQRQMGIKIAALAPNLPQNLPLLAFRDVFKLWRAPENRRFRLWHARRNVEMLAGIFMRDILRMKLKLIFTSASQRNHKAFTKWLIKRMDRVIATSMLSGRFLKVPHDVVMHGIDLKRFCKAKTAQEEFQALGLGGDYAIGCFGRLRPSKGTDLFVDAMIALLPKYPKWTALILGRTTPEFKNFEQKLSKKITDAGLEKRILILGEFDDIENWYRRLTLYVAPSRTEGFGLTPLEAMASYVPVVASDAGVYREIIVEGTGSVVPADDGQALTNAIEPYLKNLTMTKIRAQNAYIHVQKNFPLEKEAAALNAIYTQMFKLK